MSPTRKPRCLVCNRARKSRGLCQRHYMQLRNKNYDLTKVDWYGQVKDNSEAMNLLIGAEIPIRTVSVATQSPVTAGPSTKEHDAWVAMYAYCQTKGVSVDQFLTEVVVKWYEGTFPALAKGSPEPIQLAAH